MIQQQQTRTHLSYILLLYFLQSLLLEGHAVPEHKALKRIRRGNVAGRKLKKTPPKPQIQTLASLFFCLFIDLHTTSHPTNSGGL